MSRSLSRPEPLADRHEIEEFNSGEASLDDWPRRRARANQVSGASRTFVLCEARTGPAWPSEQLETHADDAEAGSVVRANSSKEKRVVGSYALASGAVAAESATGRLRRNMPDPIPVAVLARLAVDRSWQGKGLGRALFRDAARRVTNAADAIGIRGIVVHAISPAAKKFYLALGSIRARGSPCC